MYICRHCGLEYKTDEAVMCPRCQAPKGKGNNFCPFCGEQVTPEQKICMNCGVEMENYGAIAVKSMVAAGLLAIFLGSYGVHNFYLGYIKKAVIQLVSVIVGIIAYVGSLVALVAVTESYSYSSTSASLMVVLILLVCIILIIGVRIWSFVEGILILCGKINTDGKGRSLK